MKIDCIIKINGKEHYQGKITEDEAVSMFNKISTDLLNNEHKNHEVSLHIYRSILSQFVTKLMVSQYA